MMDISVICAVPPVYTAESCQALSLLQQLQADLGSSVVGVVTLADVSSSADEESLLLASLQIEFGTYALLEDVIQSLVARQLAGQYAIRRKRKAVQA